MSNELVIIRPEVAGRVVEIGFEEGRPVEKGAVLLKLDDSLNRAEVPQAEARLELAKRNFSRTEELFGNQVATARSRDEARSSLDVGTATLELAKVRLEKTQAGGALRRHRRAAGRSASATTSPSGRTCSIWRTSTRSRSISASPESYLAAVRTGQAIEIGVDAFPGRLFKGEVYAIDPRVDAGGPQRRDPRARSPIRRSCCGRACSPASR